jgi:hypothetical protein
MPITYIEEDRHDIKKDLKSHRIWITKFNKVHFKRSGPHDFWKVNFDKGGVPPQLKGVFLTITDAETAVMNYYIKPKKEAVKEEIY